MANNQLPDRLVIGIDFGTTYSGVAAAYSGRANTADDLHVVKSWPGGNSMIADKVPSEIAYGPARTVFQRSAGSSRNEPKSTSGLFNFSDMSASLTRVTRDDAFISDEVRWGYQLRQDEVRLRCIKLFLDPDQEIPSYVSKEDIREQLRRSRKDAEAVVADYLTELFKYAREALVRVFSEVFIVSTKIEVVLTVPAVWSDTAKDATLRAARKAGRAIGASVPQHMTLISEPEAAAIFALQVIQPQLLKVGDCFVLCDAGGGTVDLISYIIEDLSPLRVRELTQGTGKCCGSAIINMRFEIYCRARLGNAAFQSLCETKPRGWLAALRNFEEHVKRNYNPDEETEFCIQFPGLPDNPARGFEDGFLTMSSSDVGKLFKPVVDDVVALVESQVTKVEELGKSVAAVLLVGGFGQSECLHKALRAHFARDVSSSPGSPDQPRRSRPCRRAIEVVQPVNAWTAVVRGAVLRGLSGTDVVTSRKARYHYGITCDAHFDAAIHPESCKYWDPLDDVWRASRRMKWFVKRGQTMPSGEVIKFNFSRNFETGENRLFEDDLIISADDEAPAGSESGRTQVLCRLHGDMNKIPARHWKSKRNSIGQSFERALYEVGMQLRSGELWFDFRTGDEVHGEVCTVFE